MVTSMDTEREMIATLNNSEALRRRSVTVKYFDVTDSTNRQAREYALSGGRGTALFVANAQTDGRGRLGRSFYSPADTGLYMTLLLDVTEDELPSVCRITSMTAVAVVRAIQSVTGRECGIKWVNDIYCDGKKACGILAESFFAEGRRFVAVGVGINLTTETFPEELCDVAVSLKEQGDADLRSPLAEAVALGILEGYSNVKAGKLSYLSDYRRLSTVLGKEVRFCRNGEWESGVAVDIDGDGGLIVRQDGGETVTLSGGEITLRLRDQEGDIHEKR